MSRKNRNKYRQQMQIQNVNHQAVATEAPATGPLQNDRIIVPTRGQVLANGYCEAIGFGSIGGGGPGIGGGMSPFDITGIQPVSDTTTAFENLRWFLVSNFRQLLSELFVEIGLVQTVVSVPVDDGLRGGVMFKSKQLDEQQIKDLQIGMDRDDDLNTAGWAAKWSRLYGGGGILILVDDQDPMEPLNLKSIGPDTVVKFRAVDMWELFWDKQNVEGYDAAIQEEDENEFYNYYSEQVHKSRVMRLKGIEAPSFIRPRLRGWGVSCVEVLIRSMNQYLKATDLGFEVLDEFKLDVYKIKNLVNTLLSPNGTNQIKQQVQAMNWQKSYQNAVVMDSEDDFDHKQLSFAGLAEAMAGIRMQVAADMRMPIIKLFGQSVSAGLGNSAQDEMENYNSMVESEVRGKLKYHILAMGELKCQQLFGFIPDDLECEFKPLRELSALDQETVKTQKFTRLQQAKAAGDITIQEYRDAANKGNLFDIQLDTEEDGLTEDPHLSDVLSGENDDAGEDEAADSPEVKGKPEADAPDSRNPGGGKKDKVVNATTLDDIVGELPIFKVLERIARLGNSAEFDRASYEADGGDSWIAEGRRQLFENPGNVDEALWAKAKDASMKAFGKEKWQFVTWFYKKQGGRFS